MKGALAMGQQQALEHQRRASLMEHQMKLEQTKAKEMKEEVDSLKR